MTQLLRGAITALVTPFDAQGGVDVDALEGLIEWQLASGIAGVVPVGSTGEAATLSAEERLLVVRRTVERVAGRVPVIAGAGANDTAVAVAASQAVAMAGATHALHVSPMYNKPPQRGILAHFRAIADASPVPVLLYNVPGRTASNMEAETTLALAEHPNVCGIKEASGNLSQISQILRHRPARFAVLSGDDALTLAVVSAGGEGVVSVVSNAIPSAMSRLVDAAVAGARERAAALHARLTPFFAEAFVEANPLPIKFALAARGRCRNVLRLPLVPLEARLESRVLDALALAEDA